MNVDRLHQRWVLLHYFNLFSRPAAPHPPPELEIIIPIAQKCLTGVKFLAHGHTAAQWPPGG